jgi:hypothetical protein
MTVIEEIKNLLTRVAAFFKRIRYKIRRSQQGANVHNTGVAISMVPGQQAAIAAQAGRNDRSGPLGGISAAARINPHAGAAYSDTTRRDGTLDEFSLDRHRQPGIDFGGAQGNRHGAPTLAFLAQHLAQEAIPEDPGFDQYQAGAKAYILRRDSTVEILSSSGRLDITI